MQKLIMNGPIVDDSEVWFYDYFGDPCISPKNVLEFLNKSGNQDITLTINSRGGDVLAGSEIFTAIKDYQGNVEVIIAGIAGSMASVVAMAGDVVKISPLGKFMIHNASMGNFGDYRDMGKASELLFDTSESLANVYAAKTGKTVSEILEAMDNETWFTAEKAVEFGLADEVLFSEKQDITLIASAGDMVDKNKIAEFKAFLAEKELNKEKKQSKTDLSAEDISDIVSKIVDQKLSEKTQKSEAKAVKAAGLSKYIH
ncbi:head maturation protease, ClpP-related [Lactococcus garvieae]|uniref:ATP-dependent Clp protease proteolytic subunit n=1 Tax=Lactococcus garvieae DCC43 TaxID=1231377 RepID=K2NVY9_9LACT|nr:head maturation protease, ClpP-related [Lactococcus garvieae]EKF51723.1 Prophage Clp protease-like protein [Lactococcus garvieae DCC43]